MCLYVDGFDQFTFAVMHETQEVMVSLMQQDPRANLSKGNKTEGKNFSIGLLIMKVSVLVCVDALCVDLAVDRLRRTENIVSIQ